LRLNTTPRPGLEAGLGLSSRWRDFDSRAQYSASGRLLPGTFLRTREDEASLRADLRWGRAEAWRATLRAAVLDYRDNGSGYFDRRERELEPEVSWRPEGWVLRLRAAARRVEFGIQTVGVGIDPPRRIRDEHEAELRIERRMSSRLTLVAGYRWERARSNERVASYEVNEGLLGVRWGWER
jgi:hypothetical protein